MILTNFPEMRATGLLKLSAIIRVNTLKLTKLEYKNKELITNPVIASKDL